MDWEFGVDKYKLEEWNQNMPKYVWGRGAGRLLNMDRYKNTFLFDFLHNIQLRSTRRR